MRLLNAASRQFEEFFAEEEVPEYAILSHTWGSPREEVTLKEMTRRKVTSKAGYRKIDACCKQALRDGLHWVWVDTCCIDKTSTAELSEAINSMFRWYAGAAVCYVFLADVEHDLEIKNCDYDKRNFDESFHHKRNKLESTPFARSRWFTRGWTLQELLGPTKVVFYSKDWTELGEKRDLWDLITFRTGIAPSVLMSDSPITELRKFSTAAKMSWAAGRETTRVEDTAYCLLGLMDVNMPLLYGEGTKAFRRLQQEILTSSGDESLFAWGLPGTLQYMDLNTRFPATIGNPSQLLHYTSHPFAASPTDFANSGDIERLNFRYSHRGDEFALPPMMVPRGVRIELPVFCREDESGTASGFELAIECFGQPVVFYAALACRHKTDALDMLAIPLWSLGHKGFGRWGPPVMMLWPGWEELMKRRKIIHMVKDG